MARRVAEETVERAYTPGREASELCLSIAREAHEPFVVALPRAGRLSLGRDREASLRIGSPSLSRLHFALELAADAVLVRDLGSRNGTLCNGVIVPQDGVAIDPGDEIVAGDVRFALLRSVALPTSLRPFHLLPQLEAELLGSPPAGSPTLIAFELEAPFNATSAVLEVLRQLPESARPCCVADDTIALLASDASLATWLQQALAQRSVVLRRFWVAPAGTPPSALVKLLLRELTSIGSAPVAATPDDTPPSFRYPSLRKVHEEARRVATRSISVLILGETGTGKEVLAREIHRLSGRTGPLVAVNTAALPENLIESELFGHERGAFSGAQTAKAGLIETADKGTLFLDEIGELPLPLQAKLLRVLEDQTVRRVGANSERRVDLRVVAATHQDIESLARARSFRQDLLFRLNGVSLLLPPLRERRGEIAPLARQLLLGLDAAPPELSPAASSALEAHDWPGNVRELKHVLERALAFCDGRTIEVQHLPPALQSARRAEPAGPAASSGDVRATVKDFERERILEALREAGGNRTRAAELLGLPRRTLVYKLSKLKLADE